LNFAPVKLTNFPESCANFPKGQCFLAFGEGQLMSNVVGVFRSIVRDQSGATAIEYGLMGALISIAAITAMGSVGNSLVNTFNFVSNQETAAQAGKL
jgi:pilus assembly protein Flp/PilA